MWGRGNEVFAPMKVALRGAAEEHRPDLVMLSKIVAGQSRLPAMPHSGYTLYSYSRPVRFCPDSRGPRSK